MPQNASRLSQPPTTALKTLIFLVIWQLINDFKVYENIKLFRYSKNGWARNHAVVIYTTPYIRTDTKVKDIIVGIYKAKRLTDPWQLQRGGVWTLYNTRHRTMSRYHIVLVQVSSLD